MQELAARIRLLNAEAGDGLAVVDYFDRMIEGGVNVDTLLRGAAMLSSTIVGYESDGRRIRFAADGSLAPATKSPQPAPVVRHSAATGVVWIERDAVHVNDALILERLALAISIIAGHEIPTATSLHLLLQPPSTITTAELFTAGQRLRLNPHDSYRAVAQRITQPPVPSAPSAILVTPWGLARASIVAADVAIASAAGVGIATTPTALTDSWQTALVALRVSTEDQIGFADDFGFFMDVAQEFDRMGRQAPELRGVAAALDAGWSEAELLALAGGVSLRGVAALRHLHHSTVVTRLPHLVKTLGFDPRPLLGRTRLHIGVLLQRLSSARF